MDTHGVFSRTRNSGNQVDPLTNLGRLSQQLPFAKQPVRMLTEFLLYYRKVATLTQDLELFYFSADQTIGIVGLQCARWRDW